MERADIRRTVPAPILRYGPEAGIFLGVATMRKVTIDVPAELLRRAQGASGEGVTSTIRLGLELVAAGKAYRDLRRWKGRVAFSVSWKSLRDDRS